MKKLIYSIVFTVTVFAFGAFVDLQAATVTNCAITANTLNTATGATSTIKISTGCQSSVIKLKTTKSYSKDLITQDDLVKIIGIISRYGMPDYDSVTPQEIAYYMAKNQAAASSAIVEAVSSSSTTEAGENSTESVKNWLVYVILIVAVAGIAWFFMMWKGEEK